MKFIVAYRKDLEAFLSAKFIEYYLINNPDVNIVKDDILLYSENELPIDFDIEGEIIFYLVGIKLDYYELDIFNSKLNIKKFIIINDYVHSCIRGGEYLLPGVLTKFNAPIRSYEQNKYDSRIGLLYQTMYYFTEGGKNTIYGENTLIDKPKIIDERMNKALQYINNFSTNSTTSDSFEETVHFIYGLEYFSSKEEWINKIIKFLISSKNDTTYDEFITEILQKGTDYYEFEKIYRQREVEKYLRDISFDFPDIPAFKNVRDILKDVECCILINHCDYKNIYRYYPEILESVADKYEVGFLINIDSYNTISGTILRLGLNPNKEIDIFHFCAEVFDFAIPNSVINREAYYFKDFPLEKFSHMVYIM